MAAQAGIVPEFAFLQACVSALASIRADSAGTQLRAQELGELRELIVAWPTLSTELRAACLAVTGVIQTRRH
jgi:hypothetical protein